MQERKTVKDEQTDGRKERKKEGRNKGKREGRKDRWKEGRKKGRWEGQMEGRNRTASGPNMGRIWPTGRMFDTPELEH